MARSEPVQVRTPHLESRRRQWIVMRQSHPFREEIMRKTEGWPGLRTAVIALGLVRWTATGAMAAPLSLQHVGPG